MFPAIIIFYMLYINILFSSMLTQDLQLGVRVLAVELYEEI